MLTNKQMVENFQCPGCVCGSDTSCGKYREQAVNNGAGFYCSSHVAGTFILGIGNVALGLPKGFNKAGDSGNSPRIWLFKQPEDFSTINYDRFNIPVWSMDHEGHCFIRIYQPRVNRTLVAVIHNGKRAQLAASATDVATFLDEID